MFKKYTFTVNLIQNFYLNKIKSNKDGHTPSVKVTPTPPGTMTVCYE